MKLKAGVSIDGLRPEITGILPVVETLFIATGTNLTLTCTTGGHGNEDPHTWGFAIDCRTLALPPAQSLELAKRIQANIGADYFVQYEPQVVDKNNRVIRGQHIHIQLRKALWRAIVRSEGHTEIPEE